MSKDVPWKRAWSSRDPGLLEAFLLLLVAGSAIRLALIPFVGDLPLAGDEIYYWRAARAYGSGALAPDFWRPPLWSYVLSLAALVDPNHSSGRLLTAILGGLAPALVFLIGRTVFGRREALAAGWLFVFYPEHIGFSHYLWSEILFGTLALAATLCFFRSLKTHSNRLFYAAYAVGGLALLAKEFAGAIFIATVLAAVQQKLPSLGRRLAIAALLFFGPAALYSVGASMTTGRPILLSEAPIRNLREASAIADRDGGVAGSFDRTRMDRAQTLRHSLARLWQRGIKGNLAAFRDQNYRLWTPNSFPVTRLLNRGQLEGWSYGIRRPWRLVVPIVGYYLAVMTLALAGIVLAPAGPFKTYSLTVLGALALVGVVSFYCSRFRLPFMFIPILFAGYLLANLRTATVVGLRRPGRLLLVLALLAVFADIVVRQFARIGRWG